MYLNTLFLLLSLDVATKLWLTFWASAGDANLGLYMSVFVGLSLLSAFFSLVRNLFFFRGCCVAGREMHDGMLWAVLRAPMEFHHKSPQGRILNRFSKDIDAIDAEIPSRLSQCLAFGVWGTVSILLCCITAPFFIFFLIPIAAIFVQILRRFVGTSRTLVRLNTISSSPIFEHYSEVVDGLSSIRAYDLATVETMEHYLRVDVNAGVFLAKLDTERWSGVRQVTMTSIITFMASALANLSAFGLFMSGVPVALLAVCVSYANSTSDMFKSFVVTAAASEANMSQAERIFEYHDLKSEDDLSKHELDPGWPRVGDVEFDHVCLRYRGAAEDTLKDVSFRVLGGMKVGIVGRTGAGKSSLLIALMRIFEISSGNVKVDGVSLKDVGLHDVRKRIAIIPQDPVLISGACRDTLAKAVVV